MRRLVLAYPLVDDLAQEPVLGPGQVLDLDDELRRTQWTRESTSGELNRVERGGATSSGILSVSSGCNRRKRPSSWSVRIPEPTRPA